MPTDMSAAGIAVVEVWSGYSTTIGNLAFEASDACVSAMDIARRGIAACAATTMVSASSCVQPSHFGCGQARR